MLLKQYRYAMSVTLLKNIANSPGSKLKMVAISAALTLDAVRPVSCSLELITHQCTKFQQNRKIRDRVIVIELFPKWAPSAILNLILSEFQPFRSLCGPIMRHFRGSQTSRMVLRFVCAKVYHI